jgi:hypothetical protein
MFSLPFDSSFEIEIASPRPTTRRLETRISRSASYNDSRPFKVLNDARNNFIDTE